MFYKAPRFYNKTADAGMQTSARVRSSRVCQERPYELPQRTYQVSRVRR